MHVEVRRKDQVSTFKGSPPFSLRQCSSMVWNSPFKLDWLGSLKGITCLFLPSSGITSMFHHACLVLVSSGNGSQILVLAELAFYQLNCSLTIMSCFLISKYLHTYTPLPTPLPSSLLFVIQLSE